MSVKGGGEWEKAVLRGIEVGNKNMELFFYVDSSAVGGIGNFVRCGRQGVSNG